MCDLGDGKFLGLIEIIPFLLWRQMDEKEEEIRFTKLCWHVHICTNAWGQRVWIGILGCASWLSTLLNSRSFIHKKEKRMSSENVCWQLTTAPATHKAAHNTAQQLPVTFIMSTKYNLPGTQLEGDLLSVPQSSKDGGLQHPSSLTFCSSKPFIWRALKGAQAYRSPR